MKQMLINFVPGEECRIAIINNGKLEELFTERASATSHVGNIYKGKITNVEPSIQAAFVDFGLERNGFLHISDVHPQYFSSSKSDDTKERVGKKTPRRHRPPIQKCFRRGQDIICQVIKEGIGSKGPTLSTYISIPGRYLVMMPGMNNKAMKGLKVDEKDLKHVEAIIYSMTKNEREKPNIINGSRRLRIAKGSGTSIQEVNRLLKQFDQMKKMMKKFSSPKFMKKGMLPF